MFNAAIIGVSGFGAVHYQDFVREHAAGRIRPVGATVINQAEEPEKCAWLRNIGCPLYTDYREMLRDLAGKIDICFIPTGIALHKPMTIAALEAGANVYVEKPIAPTVTDAEAMLEASRRTGKFVAVGYQTMYQPETRRIKEMLLAGRIGKVKILKSYGLWPRDFVYYHRNNWVAKIGTRENPILDSPYSNAFAHFLNLLCFYAGEQFATTGTPESIRGAMYRANPIESCDTADLEITTREGKTIFFYVTHCSVRNDTPYSAIIGEKGSIEYTTSRTTVRDSSGEIVEEFDSTPGNEMRVHIYDALEKRLKDPSAFICTPEIAMCHTRVCNAAFDSIPVTGVPEGAFHLAKTPAGTEYRIIDGIDEAIEHAYAENRLIDKRDLPWAVNSEPFSLEGYHSFCGRMLNKN